MPRSNVRRLALAIPLAALPASALAGNGIHPRTPVLWSGHPSIEDPACMTVVNRSMTTTLHLQYAIPYEDTDITPDEVDDSRRHQFFALCRAVSPAQMLPNWITQADVDAAAAKMLTDPNSVAPEDILDQSPAWQGCFVRITPDSARLPITFAQAMMGVDFETMGIPAGAYSIWGYTWEPLFNLWKLRPGVVKVVDVPDPAQSGPALALQLPMGDPIFYKDQKGTFTACVDAMDGSEVTLLWSLASDGSGWTPIGAAEPVVQGDNTFDIDMPMPTWGTDFLLRADIEDPMGRTYTAYYSEIITVLAADDPSGCSDMGGGGFIGDPGCTAGSSGSGPSSGTSGSGGSASASGSGSGGSAGTASGGTTDTSGTSGTKENGGGGCACTSGAAPRHGAVALPLVWAFLARRRRRSGQRALEREGGIAA